MLNNFNFVSISNAILVDEYENAIQISCDLAILYSGQFEELVDDIIYTKCGYFINCIIKGKTKLDKELISLIGKTKSDYEKLLLFRLDDVKASKINRLEFLDIPVFKNFPKTTIILDINKSSLDDCLDALKLSNKNQSFELLFKKNLNNIDESTFLALDTVEYINTIQNNIEDINRKRISNLIISDLSLNKFDSKTATFQSIDYESLYHIIEFINSLKQIQDISISFKINCELEQKLHKIIKNFTAMNFSRNIEITIKDTANGIKAYYDFYTISI